PPHPPPFPYTTLFRSMTRWRTCWRTEHCPSSPRSRWRWSRASTNVWAITHSTSPNASGTSQEFADQEHHAVPTATERRPILRPRSEEHTSELQSLAYL